MRSFHEYNIEQLKDPEDASLYLTEVLADFEIDHDVESFRKALKDVTKDQGGIGELAKRTNLNRKNLKHILNEDKNNVSRNV
jgi:DNA-binding phage protein